MSQWLSVVSMAILICMAFSLTQVVMAGARIAENMKPENASHIGNPVAWRISIGETVFDKGQATRERSDEHLDMPSGGGSLSLSNTFPMDLMIVE
jgi:hypothetical protein